MEFLTHCQIISKIIPWILKKNKAKRMGWFFLTDCLSDLSFDGMLYGWGAKCHHVDVALTKSETLIFFSVVSGLK